MDFELRDPARRRNALANMMTQFGLQMVDIHESETDDKAYMNGNTVCLTRNSLIHSIEDKLHEEERNYGPTISANQYYYPEQQTTMMAPQPIQYPVRTLPQASDNFDISDYMGLPKQQQANAQSSDLEEALKPVVVRLEGICKILGIIYQEIKNNQSTDKTKAEVQQPTKKEKQTRSSKKKEKAPPKEEYKSLDDVTDADVEAFDKDGGTPEYV